MVLAGTRWLVPEQPAGCGDLREDLIFRQFARDVAAIRAGKLDIAINRQRFVIAVTRVGRLYLNALNLKVRAARTGPLHCEPVPIVCCG
jgi:hypothetical protein